MTLNATNPTDQAEVSSLPRYIRENRTEINSLISGITDYTVNTISLPTGTSTLVIGTDLSDVNIETVLISSIGASVLETITSGTNGQIKIFISQNSNVSFKDGTKADGKVYLNHLPALTDFDLNQDDILAIINIGGDGVSDNGYWKELFRVLSVK